VETTRYEEESSSLLNSSLQARKEDLAIISEPKVFLFGTEYG